MADKPKKSTVPLTEEKQEEKRKKLQDRRNKNPQTKQRAPRNPEVKPL